MGLAVARSSVAAAEPTPWPADAVEVARVVGAWGVKGWLKLQPLADDPQALLHARRWHLQAGDRAIALTIGEARRHGAALIASAHELADRDSAEALRGARVFVSRASFPALGADEFYWRDLIGLAVSTAKASRSARSSACSTPARTACCACSRPKPKRPNA